MKISPKINGHFHEILLILNRYVSVNELGFTPIMSKRRISKMNAQI